MEKRQLKRKIFGQNFLKSERLVQRLVSLSSIGNDDIVYEIGPGRGIVTTHLARVAKQVIAIEVDPTLVRYLRRRFATTGNVKIVECDFLQFRIDKKRFKVFANLPFGITAKVLSKLLYQRRTAGEIFIVVQREAALKYTGDRGETVRSLLAKARVALEIIYRFRPSDFDPEPDVHAVLLKITRLKHEAVPQHIYFEWEFFIRQGFCSWRPNARTALKNRFSYKQWKRLSRELGFELNAKPSELSFEQWLGLFKSFKKINS